MAFTDHEIAIIKGMIARGDVQSHIAAYFGGSNGGRISEINTGKKASTSWLRQHLNYRLLGRTTYLVAPR
jgi:hypothetical protein